MKSKKFLCLTLSTMMVFTTTLSTSVSGDFLKEEKLQDYDTEYNVTYNLDENDNLSVESIHPLKSYNSIIKSIISENSDKVLTNDQNFALFDDFRIFDNNLNNAISTCSVVSKKYNRSAVKKYISKWALGHNSKYVNCENKGGDCANFVSQCLFAGGLPMNIEWRCIKNKNGGFSFTKCWVKANNLFGYVMSDLTSQTWYKITKYSTRPPIILDI